MMILDVIESVFGIREECTLVERGHLYLHGTGRGVWYALR